MKTAASLGNGQAIVEAPDSSAWADFNAKFSAYVELAKLRVATLVLVTVAAGFLLGARGASHPSTLLLTVFGTALVATGASAWNQYLERFRDPLMKRTANRPLPTGRLSPAEAAWFGVITGVLGVLMLALGVNTLSAIVATVTYFLYAFVYTPLKPRTTLNTAIGAIPGALPPVIGWAGATGRLGIEAWALFLIVFLWQFPHFLAIAWIYRADYARAGHKMLPTVDPEGAITGRQAAVYALALVPAGLLPASIGLAGPVYFAGALLLGIYYLASAMRFWARTDDASARRLMKASFIYLPMILLLLLLNPMPA
ncbi:heme o synthase [Singulisphaera sp. PoT]|uniref:heme o synthase n=1 Tax=Singulisphaera sp. PoT TaxID=3411797 RepID=UPI003BF5A11F